MKIKLEVPQLDVTNEVKLILGSCICPLLSMSMACMTFEMWRDWTVAIVIGISIYLCLQLIVIMKWGWRT